MDGNIALMWFEETIEKSGLKTKEEIRKAVEEALDPESFLKTHERNVEVIINFARDAVARGVPKEWLPGLGLDIACRELEIQ